MSASGAAVVEAIHAAPSVPDALRAGINSPHRFIVVDRDVNEQSRSYSELMDGAAAGANMLRERGIAPGDRVCLLSSTSLSMINGLIATWWAGAVPVILALPRRQSELPEFLEDLRHRVTHVGASLVMVMDQFADALPTEENGPPVIPLGLLESAPHENLRAPTGRPDGLAYLQFTSGTTARSRAVALTHRQVLAQLSSMSMVTGGTIEDVVMHWLPLFHDMGLILTLGAIAHGARVALLPPEEFLARPGAWKLLWRQQRDLRRDVHGGTELRLRPRRQGPACKAARARTLATADSRKRRRANRRRDDVRVRRCRRGLWLQA